MTWARRLIPALALVIASTTTVRGQSSNAERTVLVAELDGIIQPIAAEYLTGVIDEADTSSATLGESDRMSAAGWSPAASVEVHQ
jgi:membrane-bound ClpP family serine protease